MSDSEQAQLLGTDTEAGGESESNLAQQSLFSVALVKSERESWATLHHGVLLAIESDTDDERSEQAIRWL